MPLHAIDYQPDYRSGHDDLVKDFFRPSLLAAGAYWRAVGYFSSTALEAFGTPLADFLKRDGTIRLVTSVELTPPDLEAIAAGTARRTVCDRRLEQIIDAEFADGVGDGVARLARLLELERLEIRIAVPTHGTGIYHEKIGLFLDGNDFVAFTGSSNESRNAFENNRECIDVFPSWRDRERAHRKMVHFLAIWNQEDPGVATYTFSDAIRRKLIRATRSRRTPPVPPSAPSPRWRHQDEAVAAFLRAERGVLDMATGTGKTRTAIKILTTLFNRAHIDSAIICTNGNDLLDQWYGELLSFRGAISPAPQVLRHYGPHRDLGDFVLDPANTLLLVSREPLAHVLPQLSARQSARTLLVHDEVHGLGSPANRARLAGLSDGVRFRLGLSATPEREYDAEGTNFITSHIGPVIMTFGLEDGIRRGILAPFCYHALEFQLSEIDKQRLGTVYARRAAREATGNPMTETEVWIELARVHKTSEAKLPVFADFLHGHADLLSRCIIFVETMEYGAAVLDIVHAHRSDFHTYYTHDDSTVLQRFARGELECLLTCHRLSEGIDIRTLNTVVLFASARTRLETIQRIGRCLRTDPASPTKIANIVDFVRPDGAGGQETSDGARREWLTELARVRPD